MQVLYISHPYSDSPEDNRVKAEALKHKLQLVYPDVCFINPLDVFGDLTELPYHEVLAKCLELLSRCDGIVLADGWTESKGCNAEYAFAIQQGLEIHFGYGTKLLESEV